MTRDFQKILLKYSETAEDAGPSIDSILQHVDFAFETVLAFIANFNGATIAKYGEAPTQGDVQIIKWHKLLSRAALVKKISVTEAIDLSVKYHVIGESLAGKARNTSSTRFLYDELVTILAPAVFSKLPLAKQLRILCKASRMVKEEDPKIGSLSPHYMVFELLIPQLKIPKDTMAGQTIELFQILIDNCTLYEDTTQELTKYFRAIANTIFLLGNQYMKRRRSRKKMK